MNVVRNIGMLLMLAVLPSLAMSTTPADLLAQGRADEAISSLQNEVKAHPNDAQAYNLLCRSYFSVGNWDGGIPHCEKAVSLEPGNSQYHMWLGRIYGERADHSAFWSAAGLARKLRNEMETAVRLDPANVAARTDLAEFYLEAPGIVGGGRDKAEAQAAALETLDPAKAHWVRGRLAEKRKDSASAEREYRAAIEASHGSALNWFNLALFYRHEQRWSDMEDAIDKAVAAPLDRPEVIMESGDVLIRTGRSYPKAIRLIQLYLSSKSTVEAAPAFKAHYLLGMAQEKLGDKSAAAQEYRAALALARNYSVAQDALNRISR